MPVQGDEKKFSLGKHAISIGKARFVVGRHHCSLRLGRCTRAKITAATCHATSASSAHASTRCRSSTASLPHHTLVVWSHPVNARPRPVPCASHFGAVTSPKLFGSKNTSTSGPSRSAVDLAAAVGDLHAADLPALNREPAFDQLAAVVRARVVEELRAARVGAFALRSGDQAHRVVDVVANESLAPP